jgi:hypothetical protein
LPRLAACNPHLTGKVRFFDEFVEAMAEELRRLEIEEMAAYEEEEIAAA